MLTKEQKLYTGKPVWTAYSKPRIPTLHMERGFSTDIVIIGSGVSGAMIAEALSGHGLDIAIVDRRKPLTGSTSATTALIQFEIDTPLTKLAKKIGMPKANAAWRRSRIAIESIAAKIRMNEIECSFTRKDSLYLAGNVLDKRGLEEERLARAVIGLPSELIGRRDLRDDYGMNGDAALLNQNNISCNPVQMTAGFLKAAIKRGARFYTPVEIDDLSYQGKNIILTTSEGLKIKTRYVIYASGYEMPKAVHTKKHKIASTWALGTAPVKGFDVPLFWEASDPYIYGRCTFDGRLIFGGGDEDFGDETRREDVMAAKRKLLERKVAKLFPDRKFETTHFWGAAFGSSNTSLPSIGKIPGQKNCYAALAYGGNGITFSRIAADLIAADILGYPDPEAEIFSLK